MAMSDQNEFGASLKSSSIPDLRIVEPSNAAFGGNAKAVRCIEPAMRSLTTTRVEIMSDTSIIAATVADASAFHL